MVAVWSAILHTTALLCADDARPVISFISTVRTPDLLFQTQ